MLADCHTHLDDYDPQDLRDLLQRAREAEVRLIITAGVTKESSLRGIEISQKYPEVYAGVGIHPMEVAEPFNDQTYECLKRLALDSQKVVVISETGLDYMKGPKDRKLQENAFRGQIRLAKELKLPIVFHSREAHEDTLRLLREERAYEVGAIMHYFQGDEEVANQCLDMGFYISLGRPLLRLPHLQKLTRRLPLENLVLETDSFPQPWKEDRRTWTEPAHVQQVAEKLAQLKGVTPEEIAKRTTDNLKRLLGTIAL